MEPVALFFLFNATRPSQDDLALSNLDIYLASSAMYPMTAPTRGNTAIETREGYSLNSLSPCITAEIAMQAASHSEALLRGKEQLNGYGELSMHHTPNGVPSNHVCRSILNSPFSSLV